MDESPSDSRAAGIDVRGLALSTKSILQTVVEPVRSLG
jgi:hypothetical protein